MGRRKAIGYIRVVSDDRNAIDEQRRNIENAVFERDYELAEIYTDVGSGRSAEREGIKKLLNDIERNNDVGAVFVSSTDILSTDKANTSELLEALSEHNVRLYSMGDKRFLNEPLDTLDNLSRKIYNTLTEMERNGMDLANDVSISEETAAKDPTIRLQGKIIEAYLDLGAENRSQV